MEQSRNLGDPLEEGDQSTGGSDCISCLPDSLLLHVLSFLDTRDAVRTGALSRRWQRLWTSIPILSFNGPRRPARSRAYSDPQRRTLRLMPTFLDFVGRILSLYQCPKIQKFQLCFGYKEDCVSRIDDCISFAVERSVEEFILDISRGPYVHGGYELPSWIFQSQVLKVLKLGDVRLNLPGDLHLSSLRVLSLSRIELNNSSINHIISGSPLIEDFRLLECKLVECLYISSSTLKHLRLIFPQTIYRTSPHDFNGFDIDAPNLSSISITSCMCLRVCCLRNLLSLSEANINFNIVKNHCFSFDFISNDQQSKLLKFIESLSPAKSLKLNGLATQVLSGAESKGFPPALSTFKCLTIDTGLEKVELPGLVRLLRSATALETLTINIHHHRGQHLCIEDTSQIDELTYLDTTSLPSSMDHVKAIKISGLLRRNGIQKVEKNEGILQHWLKREVNLVTFLLKNAVALEKMTIRICDKKYFELLQQREDIDKKLLAIPWASPDAVLSFSYD